MTETADSAVVRLLYEFRVMLDAREDAVMRDLARRYLLVQSGVEADLTALALEMERRRAEGRVITEQLIWRDERFKRTRAQLQTQLSRFNGEAITEIERAQVENATLGIRAANEAIYASYMDAGAMGPAWNRLNINAIESMIGFAADGTPLSKLLKADYPLALDGITQALINGMTRGLGAGQIARDMVNGSGMGLERALLIARTEAARAYRTGSTKQYRDSGVVEGFYRLVKKATACAACLMLDGQRFDTREELSDHPRGKCTAVPGVIGVGKPKWFEGPQWFMQQSPEDQRRILGAKRYDLWQRGEISLDSIARLKHDPTWGDQPVIATIKELTE